MIIDFKEGSHSKDDEVIFLTCIREAITLEDVFEIVRVFAKNELHRIRVDAVREQIALGERVFMFEDKIKDVIEKVKGEFK